MALLVILCQELVGTLVEMGLFDLSSDYLPFLRMQSR